MLSVFASPREFKLRPRGRGRAIVCLGTPFVGAPTPKMYPEASLPYQALAKALLNFNVPQIQIVGEIAQCAAVHKAL